MAQQSSSSRGGSGNSPQLAAALAYVARGWRVIPLHSPTRNGGCTCGRAECASIGKHPRTRSGLKDSSASSAVIQEWWRTWGRANIGIVTGARSGLVVLDVDARHSGHESLITLQERYGALPETLRVATGGGGEHWYFRHPGADVLLRNVAGLDDLSGLDIRGDGGYVVAPPSWHQSGAQYEWIMSPKDAPTAAAEEGVMVATLPSWLLALLSKPRAEKTLPAVRPAPDRLDWAVRDTAQYWLDKALERAREGTRNDRGFWLACQLRDAGLTMDEAESWMRDYATQTPGRGYSAREALSSLRQAYLSPARESARSREREREPAKNRQRYPTRGANALAAVPFDDDGEDGEDDDGAGGKGTGKDKGNRGEDGPPKPPPGVSPDGRANRTDLGNARRLVERHGENMRFVATWNQWLIWDGRRWRRDTTAEAFRLAKETVASIYLEVLHSEESDERKEIVKWAVKSEAEARIRSMLALAQSEPEIALDSDAFDRSPYLLTVENGTLDLRGGKLLPHERRHLLTRLAPVVYDPEAQCPTWLTFLTRIMDGDAALIAFLQRAIGYSLTDDTSEQVLFLLHGNGQNGKSKMLEAIEGVVGDYGMQTPTTTLMAKRDNNIPNDVARLKGARFVKAIETDEGHALAESLVKQMTGGDMLSARFMRGEWFDFRPSFKLWLAANHLPQIRGNDDGIWRRIRYIPFEVQIPEDERDNHLGEKLQAEYSGILAWAVQGCLMWQREGLKPPEKVTRATSEYRETMDRFSAFLDDCCVLSKNATVSAKRLRIAYEQWCTENGEHPKNQTWFGLQLQRRGITKVRSNTVTYFGIGLVSMPVQSSLPE